MDSKKGSIYVCLLVICMAWGSRAMAQETPVVTKAKSPRQVALLYNLAHIGHNISLNYNHYFGRHALTGGLHFQLGTTIHKNSSRFKGYRFKPDPNSRPPVSGFASDFRERIGLNLRYLYSLKKAKSWLSPYAFYQLQATFSIPTYVEVISLNTGQQYTAFGGSYTVFENSVGVGIRPAIYDRFHLDVSMGVITAALYNESGSFGKANPTPSWFNEQSILVRVGVLYQLRKP